MSLKSLKLAALAVALSLPVAGGFDLWPAAAAPAPAIKPPGPGRILFFQQGTGFLTLVNPDGSKQQKVGEHQPHFSPSDHAKLSPDGKRVAFLVVGGKRDGRRSPPLRLHLRGLGKDDPVIALGIPAKTFAWSADGTELAVTDFDTNHPDAKFAATHFLVNVKTRKKTALALPSGHIIRDWSRDGKHLLTEQVRTASGRLAANRLFLMKRDGTGMKAVTPQRSSFFNARLSPDGKRILALHFAAGKPGSVLRRHPVVVEVSTGKTPRLANVAENADAESCCWSPDGKRIAYSWKQIPKGKPEDIADSQTQARLTVCDPDGKNARTIVSVKGKGPFFVFLGCIDWR